MRNTETGPVERVWRTLPASARHTLESELAPTDLHTLQMDLARTRSGEVTPASVMRRWKSDRFVVPSATDPRVITAIEALLWDLLPARFAPVALAPVVPLGSCSAVAPVDQNRIVSTTRGTEVLSDPTNALAIEAAWRRRHQRANRIDLAAAHRVLRAQQFDAPLAWPHFQLFALVSSGRDQGSGRTQAGMLLDHVQFWQAALGALLPHRRSIIRYTLFVPSALGDRIADSIRPALDPHATTGFTENPDRKRGAGYYSPAAIQLAAYDGYTELEMGDGGFVDWTAQLNGNAKERCFISCLSLERMATLMNG